MTLTACGKLLVVTASTMIIFSVVARGFSPLSREGRRVALNPIRNVACSILHNGNGKKNCGTELFSTQTEDEKKVPPMTLLSGFLGSGKTTTLQNLLNNKDGIKIGIVVNDVAAVNIDSKLLSNPNLVVGGEETLELQNGCACCSLADELITTVQQLTNDGKRDLDHIVIELSGVADPMAVKQNWEAATMKGHPATKLATMGKVVTLVDSSTFGTDWMTWDASGDREGWVAETEGCGTDSDKMVPELLSEQIEAADVLVLNKVDIAGEEQVSIASKLVKAMNKKASVYEVAFGDITVRDVIGAPSINTDSDDCTDPGCSDSSHSHSHEHADNSCDEPSCDDPTHDHSHSHEHADATCTEPSCDDSTHDHSHSHEHADATCTDPTHDHSHSHEHDDATCTDPTHDHSHSHEHDDATCTDPTHDHSHSHDHSTSMDALGISNFVYKSDRPFNAIRLMAVLHTWPVPVKDYLDLDLLTEASKEGFELGGETQRSPFVGILRSKGFCWMAPTMWHGVASDAWRHNTAMFWSHAGKHFGVTTAGKWWGTIKKEQMKTLFTNNMKEYERIIEEDFVSEEFGDRRQEIVFIGANINATEITEALDECLCTDEEMEAYREDLAEFQKPATTARARPTRTFQAVGPPEDEG